MAGSKRKKEVKQKEVPKGKIIAQGGDPERYYSENPAWTFANSDQVQFTALSGRHSVLERPLSGENGRPFLVITPEIIGY